MRGTRPSGDGGCCFSAINYLAVFENERFPTPSNLSRRRRSSVAAPPSSASDMLRRRTLSSDRLVAQFLDARDCNAQSKTWWHLQIQSATNLQPCTDANRKWVSQVNPNECGPRSDAARPAGNRRHTSDR